MVTANNGPGSIGRLSGESLTGQAKREVETPVKKNSVGLHVREPCQNSQFVSSDDKATIPTVGLTRARRMYKIPDMLQFRHTSPSGQSGPPNYMSRRVQLRLLILVSSLLGVALLMAEVRKPKFWDWMWHGQQLPAQSHQNGSNRNNHPTVDSRISTRIFENDANVPDALIIRPHQSLGRFVKNCDSYFPGVEADLLEVIEDDRLLHHPENAAWCNLLEILQESEPEELERASEGQVGFVSLFQQPAAYRGRLVTFLGSARRVEQVPAWKNHLGIEDYFVCWLRPSGGPNAPVNVYALELPKGFPVGNQIRESVELTGFFFKRLPYSAQDGTRTAPLIIAKTMRWNPKAATPKQTVPGPLGTKTPIVAIAGLLVGTAILSVSLAGLIYWLSIRRQPIHGHRTGAKIHAEQIEQLLDRDVVSTRNTLRKMEDL
ncbi:MAG: hypothetical protein CMJ81_20575 [Planctomycetaceae bacterium]|nr:hypothetical protein [Planctomycetaceae bacterium]MBP63447.1 hypothetical protein [Planctomycetaceae bacterium]